MNPQNVTARWNRRSTRLRMLLLATLFFPVVALAQQSPPPVDQTPPLAQQPAQSSQHEFDLLIKGGEVIDPHDGLRAIRDIGIRDHKIAAVEKNIPVEKAGKVINAH